ncbi:low molecular weight phosphatase family protein [Streptomyces sp. NPDC002932]|uniref:arsenate-mycothiol transferase ArsC n=1 Tax=Streptomyces sp. NPDC002932 TaxID=3364672 RepID=UPI0036AEED13
MSEPRHVLVVCMGNYCRSPLAALLISATSDGAIEAKSAGLRDWHIGEAAHPLMITTAADLGYDLTRHRGAELTPELIEWADALVAVDDETARALAERAPGRPVHVLAGGVADPYKQPPQAFIDAAHQIERAAREYSTSGLADRP